MYSACVFRRYGLICRAGHGGNEEETVVLTMGGPHLYIHSEDNAEAEQN